MDGCFKCLIAYLIFKICSSEVLFEVMYLVYRVFAGSQMIGDHEPALYCTIEW